MVVAVVWFRNSLRIHDNPVLSWVYESENVDSILPIYIFDEEIQQKSTRTMGEQRLRFQFDCVDNLHQNLKDKLDLDLHVFSGDSIDVLENFLLIIFNVLITLFNVGRNSFLNASCHIKE